MEKRLAERRPMQLITMNTKTGEVKTLLKSNRLAEPHRSSRQRIRRC